MARDIDEQYPNKSISSSKKDDKWTNPKGKEKNPHGPDKKTIKPKPKDKRTGGIGGDGGDDDYTREHYKKEGIRKWHDDKPKDKKTPSPYPKTKPKDDGYGDDNKPTGGSKVPSKPGPKKPMTPAAKRLKRTASRSK
jgi:hypothetical protein